ncbi:hypothetical protein HID58_095144 [Brassica napus]|uniref:Dilute domain-containing protein n=1 Tax=Brassica napus TaxID=3708 RepID=A0ABQ7X4T7_BRANA|nr:hypothetical protein HID58_095144 [Brassica napus]
MLVLLLGFGLEEKYNAYTGKRKCEAPVDKVTSVLVKDTEKIFSLTSEVEALQVPDNNQVLAYWLSNSTMLLKLLQHTFTSAAYQSPEQMQVEAKYPATLSSKLIGFLEKMYVMIRDNLKIEVFSLLRRKKKCSSTRFDWSLGKYCGKAKHYLNLMKANNVNSTIPGQQINHTNILLHQSSAPKQACMFTSSNISFSFVSSILLSDDCRYFVNGEYVETGLAKLKNWCIEATDEYAGSAWDELSHIRQAAGFLQAIIQKQEMTLDKITRELCPVLSIRQLYRISAMYFDDIYDMSSVSSDVISSMMIRLIDDLTDGVRSDSLLEDDLSIPFTVEDLSKSTEQGDVNDIDTLALIHENPSFSFLLTCGEGIKLRTTVYPEVFGCYLASRIVL